MLFAQAEALEWVERLGGWAVVCFIVYWLTMRWEKRMEALTQAIKDGAAEDRESQRRHEDKTDRVLSEVREIKQREAS